MRLALLLLTLTVCWTANAQSTIANGTLNYAVLNGASSLRDGLLAYYKLDETSGTRVDSYGTNNLTDNNSVGYTSGKVVNAGTFVSASNQYLSLSSSSTFDFGASDKYSVFAWVRLTNISSLQFILSKIGPSGYRGWALYMNGGKLYASIEGGGYIYKAASMSWNDWHHVGLTYDGSQSTNGLALYLDGASTASESGQSGVVSPQNTGTFKIGARENNANARVDGAIDEVGVWNRVLTAAEIAVLYKSGTGTTFPYFSRRSQPLDFDWDNWQPLQLPEQIPVAYLNRKPELLSLCE